MIENKEKYQDKRVMIGTDSQSCLKALALGPLNLFHYLGMDLSLTWEKLMVLDGICEEVVLQYVPAHVGLIGNELADQWANQAVMQYTDHTQAKISISLSLFKAFVKNKATKSWKLWETQRQESNLRQR
eukprot:1933377-Ditylum_brightwellii.AAC.1